MYEINYRSMVLFISLIWIVVRALVCLKYRNFSLKREGQLIFVYICIIVSFRFTFFPFTKIDGVIQPLVFDIATAFPPRINLVPFVNLLDYPNRSEIYLNLIGNTTMFIPMGIVWPSVFRKLDSHRKIIAAGFGLSLAIEILQLPFYDRVTDIDDLILNTLGFLMGYSIYLLVKRIKHK